MVIVLKAQRIEEAHISVKAKVSCLSMLGQTKSPSLPFLSVHVLICAVFQFDICNSL